MYCLHIMFRTLERTRLFPIVFFLALSLVFSLVFSLVLSFAMYGTLVANFALWGQHFGSNLLVRTRSQWCQLSDTLTDVVLNDVFWCGDGRDESFYDFSLNTLGVWDTCSPATT